VVTERGNELWNLQKHGITFIVDPNFEGGNVSVNAQNLKAHAMKFFNRAKEFARNRKGIAVLAAVAVLVIAGASIASAAADGPEDVVRKFEEAVHNNDVAALEEILSPDDDRMKIDRKHLAQFLQLMQTNKEYMEATMSLLHYQSATYQADGNVSYGSDEYAWVDYYLKWEEGVLFDSYSIGVRPYYLHIKASETGGTVKVDGKEVLTPKQGASKVLGPLMPGKYKVEGTKKYPYALVSDTRTVELFGNEEGRVEVEVDLTGTYIQLDSAFKDTRVIVNGKPIHKTVEELQKFGPVSLNGSITLQGERKFPWGVSRSDEKKVTENTTNVDLTPKPFADKKGKDRIVQTINTFFKQWIAAKERRDPSIFTVGGDDLKRELIEEIEDIKEDLENPWGAEPFKGVPLGTRIDFDNLEFTYANDHYVVKIPVEFHSKNNDNFEDRMEEEFEVKLVELRYDEKGKRWLVHSDETIYGLFRTTYFQGGDVVKSEFK
jgi:uncharacterized membrane protein YvbJ